VKAADVDTWVKKRSPWELFSMLAALVLIEAWFFWLFETYARHSYWRWVIVIALFKLGEMLPKFIRMLIKELKS
jgi:hypothetical protein